jgi:DNA-binding MarR family transcriptional regulator
MSTVVWDDDRGRAEVDLSTEAADALGELFAFFGQWARRQAAGSGATLPRLRLLYQLHCEGPRKMVELADELGVSARNVTALVDGLEAEGLVRRVPHPTDRRVTMIEMTGRADDAAARFLAYRASVAALLDELSEADRRALIRISRRLVGRLEAASAER